MKTPRTQKVPGTCLQKGYRSQVTLVSQEKSPYYREYISDLELTNGQSVNLGYDRAERSCLRVISPGLT